MKAVLLSAGIGARLRPYTERMPKCMVPLAGKPILQHNIEWLRAHGTKDIAINLHHLPGAVTEYFGDGRKFGVTIQYLYERRLHGTAGTVAALAEWLGSKRFFVVYADNVTNCDLAAVSDLHKTTQATVTMALFRRRGASASGVASVGRENKITEFVEKPSLRRTGVHWVNAGLLLCETEVLRFIPPKESDFGRDVIPALVRTGAPVIGYRMQASEWLYWIDTPEDLAEAKRSFESSP